MFSTLDIIAAPGYSSTRFDVIAGVDLTITGAKVVFHNEPYIVHDPQRQRRLDTFLAREAGRPLRLDCQVEYFDDKRCPPLVQAAKLRVAQGKPVPAMARNA